MSKLTYGLNFTKNSQLGQRPPPAKRKPIFDDDDDSGPEDGPDEQPDPSESISTLGGLQNPSTNKHSLSSRSSKPPPPPPSKKTPKISPYGSLSTTHTSSKQSKAAEDLDPSIYDYDSFVSTQDTSSTSRLDEPSQAADRTQKPKYMTSLLAAAQVRKRDQLRAKEKVLAREREEEGGEFDGKEAFVTGAYKRQMEEVKKAEEEEVRREEADRKRGAREGGGMKGFYTELLGKEEERHKRAVEAGEKGVPDKAIGEGEAEGKKGKSEGEVAKEKGAMVNEEGEVVDKRQLLSAGLNADAGAKRAKAVDPRETKRKRAREGESRDFEEMLLAKGGADESDEGGEDRAVKSRKMEDELLAAMGSP